MKVHFKGWAAKWDEAFPRVSNKLAELGTHTSGKDTGAANRQQGLPCKLSGEDISALIDKLQRLATAETSADVPVATSSSAMSSFELFWRDEIVPAVDCILTSAFPDPADVPVANNFLREVLEVLVHKLKEGKFNIGSNQMLRRMLILEE